MKTLAEIKLPVFLPNNNRNWDQVDGIATISEEGEVVIKLKPEAAEQLLNLARNNILVQCSFDFRMTQEQIDEINRR